MTWLSLLLIVKIVVTSILVALPFLLLPKIKLEKLTKIKASSNTFFRLYGMAILALLIGYSFGISPAENNQFPWGVASMGLVSNSGATVILLLSNSSRQNQYLSVFFGLIAVGLITSMIAPEVALQKAW